MEWLRLILIPIFCMSASLEGAFILQNGKLKNAEKIATLSVEEHFRKGCEAFDQKDYKEALKQFVIVTTNFQKSSYYHDSLFLLGVSEYYIGDFESANESFSKYLKGSGQPKHFEEVIGYKFAIAEEFRGGARCHFLGTKQLPKWASGNTLALQIYDEIICSLPSHEYAALSLYSKAYMLWKDREWKESIEAFQMLIRRFPKHELTPISYLCINKVYLEQCETEFQNPDLLALAEINLRKFKLAFPKEEKLKEAESDIKAIKEVYAMGLYETGLFYERISKKEASVIYYLNAIKQFPDTNIAELCRKRLAVIKPT